MATYTLTAGQRAAHDKALVASTVDTVTFTDSYREVLVRNVTGTSPIYFTIDGSTPTVSGPNTYKVPAQAAATRIVLIQIIGPPTIKLISAGTMTYDVEGVDRENLV